MDEQKKSDEWDVVFPVRRDPPRIHRRIKSTPIGETMPVEEEGVALQAASSVSRAFRSTAIPKTRPVRIGRTAMQVLRDQDQAKFKPGEAEEIERVHWNAMRYLQRQALTVSHPNDPAEKEADEMADRVMRFRVEREVGEGREGIGLDVAREGQVSRSIDAEREDEEAGETVPIRIAEGVSRKAATEEDLTVSRESAEQIARVTSSGGKPLENAGFFEERMGADFSDVRVHTGPEAAKAAEGVQAKAFTLGRDVVFGEGQYRPETSDGKRLIAHELTHTLQQGSATPKRGGVFAKLARSVGKLWRQVVQREPAFDLDSAVRYNTAHHKANIYLLQKLNRIAQDPILFELARSSMDTGRDFALLVRAVQKRLFPTGPATKHDGKLGPETVEAGEAWLARHPGPARQTDAGVMEKLREGWRRLGYVKDAAGLAVSKIWPKLKEKAEESVRSMLEGLGYALLISGLILAITTLAGAIIGAFFGGVGAAPGALIGLEVGLIILKWLGLAFMVFWIGSRIAEIGASFWRFLERAWNSGGDPDRIDAAADAAANAAATTLVLIFEILLGIAIAKGLTFALARLRGTAFARWIGETRLVRWLRRRHAESKPREEPQRPTETEPGPEPEPPARPERERPPSEPDVEPRQDVRTRPERIRARSGVEVEIPRSSLQHVLESHTIENFDPIARLRSLDKNNVTDPAAVTSLFKPRSITNQSELFTLVRQILQSPSASEIQSGKLFQVTLRIRGETVILHTGAVSGGGSKFNTVYPLTQKRFLTRAEIEAMAVALKSGSTTLRRIRIALATKFRSQ